MILERYTTHILLFCLEFVFKKQNSDCLLNVYHNMSIQTTVHILYNILNIPIIQFIIPILKTVGDSGKLKLNIPSLRSQDLYLDLCTSRASQVAQAVKTLLAMWEIWVRSLRWEDPLDEGMATHSSILAWRIPWTEEPDRLQSKESQSQTQLSN